MKIGKIASVILSVMVLMPTQSFCSQDLRDWANWGWQGLQNSPTAMYEGMKQLGAYAPTRDSVQAYWNSFVSKLPEGAVYNLVRALVAVVGVGAVMSIAKTMSKEQAKKEKQNEELQGIKEDLGKLQKGLEELSGEEQRKLDAQAAESQRKLDAEFATRLVWFLLWRGVPDLEKTGINPVSAYFWPIDEKQKEDFDDALKFAVFNTDYLPELMKEYGAVGALSRFIKVVTETIVYNVKPVCFTLSQIIAQFKKLCSQDNYKKGEDFAEFLRDDSSRASKDFRGKVSEEGVARIIDFYDPTPLSVNVMSNQSTRDSFLKLLKECEEQHKL